MSTRRRRLELAEQRLGDGATWPGGPLAELERVGAAGLPAGAGLIHQVMLHLWTAASDDARGEQTAYRTAINLRFAQLSAEAGEAINRGEWEEGCSRFLAATTERPRHGIALV